MIPGPGWYRDPYFLKHERYWDNGWTDQVRRVEDERTPAVATNGAATRRGSRGRAAANGAKAGNGSKAAPAAGAGTRAAAGNGAGARSAGVAAGVAAGAAAASAAGAARSAAGGPTTPPPEADARTAAFGLWAVPENGHVAPVAPGKPQANATGEGAGVVYEDDTLTVQAFRRSDDTATVPAPGAESDTLVVPAVAGNGDSHAPQQLLQWDNSRAGQEEAAAERARARHRRFGFVAVAAVLIIGVVAAAIVATSGGGNGHPNAGSAAAPPTAGGSPGVARASSPSAAATMTAVATKTIAQKTVVASITVSPTDGSQPALLTGSGAFILASGLGPLSVSLAGTPTQEENLVFQGQTVYVNVANSPIPGKSWVVASTNDVPPLGAGSDLTNLIEVIGNPGLLGEELKGQSLSVSSSGTTTVGGKTLQAYQVGFTSGPTISGTAGFGSHTSEEVDVGGGGLVRRIVISPVPVTVNGQTVNETISLTYAHFGKPLVFSTPPPSQLMTLAQYLTRPPTSASQTSSGSSSD